MKKILVMLTVLALALAALPMTLAEEATSLPEENAAVWTLPETTEITPEQQAIFDKAMEGLVGVNYTPAAFLAEHEGVLCFLCRAQVVYPNAAPYYALVYVTETGVQNIWDIWLDAHALPKAE